jgi:hypothetical protein
MHQLRHKAKSSPHRSEGTSLATPGNDPSSTEESSPRIARGTVTNRSSHRPVLALIGVFAVQSSAMLAWAGPGQLDSKSSAKPVNTSSPYAIVSHIDEADQQISLKDGKLLTHRRAIDPFGLAIGGKFKGLPIVAEHPAANPAKTNAPFQVPVAADGPTLEKAVQQLSIGGVDIAGREALIGFRSVHEGDLMVLELGGRQFAVWVQSIDQRGVQFCDINLQQHATKQFRFGPSELPDDLAGQQTNVRDFLKQDGN